MGLRDLQARLSYLRTASFTGEPRRASRLGRHRREGRRSPRAGGCSGSSSPGSASATTCWPGRLDELQAGVRFNLAARTRCRPSTSSPRPPSTAIRSGTCSAAEAFNDARLTYDVRFGRFRLFARAFARFFADDASSRASPAPLAAQASALPRAARRARDDYWPRLRAPRRLLRGRLRRHPGRRRLSTRRARLRRSRRSARARRSRGASRTSTSATTRADRSRALVRPAGGAALQLRAGLALHRPIEENINRFYASQFRLMAARSLVPARAARRTASRRPRWGASSGDADVLCVLAT